jgi:hypothetical protein
MFKSLKKVLTSYSTTYQFDSSLKNEVLRRVKVEKNILRIFNKMKANWTDHILHRNCLLQIVTEGKNIRQEGGEEGVSSYWMTLRENRRFKKLRGKALDPTLWRTRFGRGYEPVVRHYVMIMMIMMVIV